MSGDTPTMPRGFLLGLLLLSYVAYLPMAMAAVSLDETIVYPSNAYPIISGYYSTRSPHGAKRNSPHQGLDIVAPLGTRVFAGIAGSVVRIDNETKVCGGYTVFVLTRLPLGKTPRHYRALYSHLQKVLVRRGQSVTPATIVGTVGRLHLCGDYQRPHLHFGMWQRRREIAVDPTHLLIGRTNSIECVKPGSRYPLDAAARRRSGRPAIPYPVECNKQ